MDSITVYVAVNTVISIKAEWHGGAYVDLMWNGPAHEVINVWDDATGKPKIPLTTEALTETVNRWMDTYREDLSPADSREALMHDILNHWRY